VKNIWLIYCKELRSYFSSPIAYVVMFLYAFIFGYFFYNAVDYFQRLAMRAQAMGQAFPMNINEIIMRPLLMNASVVGLFLIPMICMRLFAEEKRSGTIELLMTSPVRDIEVILGKWLAALALYAVILVVSAVNFTFLFVYGKPDWKPLLVGFLGLLLQGGALLAIGIFLSTLTRNQIIAGAASFCVFLLLWVLSWGSDFDSSTLSKVRGYLSVVTHLEPFAKGLIDLKDVVYFLSAIFLGLFLTARSTESLRWRA